MCMFAFMIRQYSQQTYLRPQSTHRSEDTQNKYYHNGSVKCTSPTQMTSSRYKGNEDFDLQLPSTDFDRAQGKLEFNCDARIFRLFSVFVHQIFVFSKLRMQNEEIRIKIEIFLLI